MFKIPRTLIKRMLEILSKAVMLAFVGALSLWQACVVFVTDKTHILVEIKI